MHGRLSSTLILAAITSEVHALVRRLKLSPARRARGDDPPGPIVFTGPSAVVAVTGIGAARAQRAAETLCRMVQPDRVIITGFAGATDPALTVGDVIEPATLIRAGVRGVYHPSAATRPHGRLLTCDHLVSSVAEKARLRTTHGADAVDMESAALAAWCDQQRLSWTCVRAISDAASDALPPFATKLTRPDGRPNLYNAMACGIMNPRSVPRLIRLGRGARRAAAALADRLRHEVAR